MSERCGPTPSSWRCMPSSLWLFCGYRAANHNQSLYGPTPTRKSRLIAPAFNPANPPRQPPTHNRPTRHQSLTAADCRIRLEGPSKPRGRIALAGHALPLLRDDSLGGGANGIMRLRNIPRGSRRPQGVSCWLVGFGLSARKWDEQRQNAMDERLLGRKS